MSILIATTQNRGLPPEYWAQRLRDKLIHISEDAPPFIRDQAEAFRERLATASLAYMKHAIMSDRTTVAAALRREGMEMAAQLVENL